MRTRLFAPNREEILGPEDWREHAPSAAAHAQAWVGGGEPRTPPELLAALQPFCEPDEIRARPAHPTAHGEIGVFACLRQGQATTFVAGIESPSPEPSDGNPDALSQALFGHPADAGARARHGHLWASAVATIAEAQERDVGACAMVVHGDGGDAVAAFADAVARAGNVSHAAAGIEPGTALHVVQA